MSLLTSEPRELRFLARFENVWESLRRYQVRQGLCWTFLAAALGLTVLVVADYLWELPRSTRAAGLAIAGALTLAIFVARVLVPIRWWTRPRTAVEIEHRFPQLGQRIRTVVQYGGLPEETIESEGMYPSLVTALEEETEVQAQPLPLDQIVPWRRVWAAAALAALPALVLIIAALASVEWRIALERALLGNRPYTVIQVKPGSLMVEQGDSVPIAVELTGRIKRTVVLYTRPGDQPTADWKATPLETLEHGPASRRESRLEKIKDPVSYRIVAGPAESAIYRIAVRYPLAIKTFEAALRPPPYTGVKPSTVKGGDLQVIEGTGVTLKIVFDAPTSEASLVITDPSARPKDKDTPAPAPQIIPLKSDGKALTAELNLTKDLVYRIEARTKDGRALPKNRYRIGVREDRAPRVAFESPDETLEVHPIAEVLHRIRVGDDFGLTRAGVVFQFNNGDEQTLILKDFTTKPGEKATTTSALEEMLLLEKLAASATDSVTYYAFVEDNYPTPNGPKRTETDLRYIDIRPFKREYKSFDPADSGMGEDEVTSLGELIARQRFNLNRGVRLAKHRPTDKTPAEDPLKLAGFEETLAGLTREFTEGLEGVAGFRVEPLHEAEESMLAAVATLDRGRNADAATNMGDALRHLIEARKSIIIAILDGSLPSQKLRRAFDRMQAQKIRKKPKEKEDEEEAIAEELEELAQEEDFVYATLAAVAMGDQPADKGETGEQAEKREKAEKDAEKGEKDAQDKANEPNDNPSPKGENGPKSPERKNGPKGPRGTGKGQSQGTAGEKGEPDDRNGPGDPKKDGQGAEKGEPKDQGGAGDPKKEGRGGDKEESDDKDGAGNSKKDLRREAAERQEKIADKARELEERLKRLEAASNLARARMTKAAEATEKTSGALARGHTKEATETAKSGAAMLHELARQVKGEIAKEVADELAMARDLADELADREAELGQMPEGNSPSDSPGDSKGKEGEKGSDGKGGPGKGSRGGIGDLTDAERLERIEEAAKTLEEWLKGASQRAEGKTGEQVRELMEQSLAGKVAENVERIGALYLSGEKPEARKEATDLSKKLEVLARELDLLHRGIVAPQLAMLVEYDQRVAELTEKLKTLKTDADITDWHRLAAALIRDLEKAGLTDAAAALAATFDASTHGGGWHWNLGPNHSYVAPLVYTTNLHSVTIQLQRKIQDLILKDLVSARDEATPPEFKELVERYYEVLSKDSGGK